MGFFDRLFGTRVPQHSHPEQLRTRLLDAAAVGDGRRLEQLCRANREAIVAHFSEWKKVPEQFRVDPAATQRYVEGLMAVAQTFAKGLGSAELIQRLVGHPQDNPLLRWQGQLQQAQALMAELRYNEAAGLLSDLLTSVRGLKSSGPDTYLPVTVGYLAECHFQSREAEKAVPLIEQALDLCKQHGDAEGVVAYLGNLYEAHRYLGHSGQAADYAERRAEALERQGREAEARRYRRQADIVRAGEPLNRVVAVVNGQQCELDEVGPIGERMQFVFARNRITLRRAAVLTERGERAGRAGKYEEALGLFREAAAADPFDPHARYEQAFSLLLLRHYADAAASYAVTEELAPGWFHCRSGLWLAQQMLLGNVDHETFLALYALEDGPLPPADRVRLAEGALSRSPRLAALHLFRGKNLALTGRHAEARTAFREGLACDAEPDVKTRLLAELGVSGVEMEERTALLQAARALNGNLVAAATAALFLKTSAARS